MSASLAQCPTANQQEMFWNKTQHPAKVTDLFSVYISIEQQFLFTFEVQTN